jgi:hypothetical protein
VGSLLRYDARVKFALLALAASGCSFSVTFDHRDDAAPISDAGSDAMTGVDASTIDASPPIDAVPDGMPMWVQVEMINVPCSGTEVQPTTVLANNTTYRLRVTGDCIANNDPQSGGGDVHGDAEYIWNQFSVNDSSANVDMGVAINDTTPGVTKLPNWGTYTTTHSYTAMWIGVGARIVAKFHDPNYANNSGQLVLYIDSFQ